MLAMLALSAKEILSRCEPWAGHSYPWALTPEPEVSSCREPEATWTGCPLWATFHPELAISPLPIGYGETPRPKVMKPAKPRLWTMASFRPSLNSFLETMLHSMEAIETNEGTIRAHPALESFVRKPISRLAQKAMAQKWHWPKGMVAIQPTIYQHTATKIQCMPCGWTPILDRRGNPTFKMQEWPRLNLARSWKFGNRLLRESVVITLGDVGEKQLRKLVPTLNKKLHKGMWTWANKTAGRSFDGAEEAIAAAISRGQEVVVILDAQDPPSYRFLGDVRAARRGLRVLTTTGEKPFALQGRQEKRGGPDVWAKYFGQWRWTQGFWVWSDYRWPEEELFAAEWKFGSINIFSPGEWLASWKNNQEPLDLQEALDRWGAKPGQKVQDISSRHPAVLSFSKENPIPMGMLPLKYLDYQLGTRRITPPTRQQIEQLVEFWEADRHELWALEFEKAQRCGWGHSFFNATNILVAEKVYVGKNSDKEVCYQVQEKIISTGTASRVRMGAHGSPTWLEVIPAWRPVDDDPRPQKWCLGAPWMFDHDSGSNDHEDIERSMDPLDKMVEEANRAEDVFSLAAEDRAKRQPIVCDPTQIAADDHRQVLERIQAKGETLKARIQALELDMASHERWGVCDATRQQAQAQLNLLREELHELREGYAGIRREGPVPKGHKAIRQAWKLGVRILGDLELLVQDCKETHLDAVVGRDSPAAWEQLHERLAKIEEELATPGLEAGIGQPYKAWTKNESPRNFKGGSLPGFKPMERSCKSLEERQAASLPAEDTLWNQLQSLVTEAQSILAENDEDLATMVDYLTTVAQHYDREDTDRAVVHVCCSAFFAGKGSKAAQAVKLAGQQDDRVRLTAEILGRIRVLTQDPASASYWLYDPETGRRVLRSSREDREPAAMTLAAPLGW